MFIFLKAKLKESSWSDALRIFVVFHTSHDAAPNRKRLIRSEFTMPKIGIKKQVDAVAKIHTNVILVSWVLVKVFVIEGSPAFS